MQEFTILLLAHFIGDYYLQTQRMAIKKDDCPPFVLVHAFIYALTMFATLFIYRSRAYLIAVSISAASHLIIDCTKQCCQYFLNKKDAFPQSRKRIVFVADQIAHLSIIAALSFFCAARRTDEFIPQFLSKTVPELIKIDAFRILAVFTLILGVMKPANIFISVMLSSGKKDDKEATRLKFGKSIGTLERIIISALLLFGQYAAIAIVFTAKSIVRFKDFEDRGFAEYYLYGTLLSVCVCLGIFAALSSFGTL